MKQNQGKEASLNNYRIFETEQFRTDLNFLTSSNREKTANRLQEFVYPQLRQHPHYGPYIKKLKGLVPNTWRYRIGAWRFYFEIDEKEKIIFMLAASHRSVAY